ncbi:MAG: zf-HC2 domain-containing protein [Planctomycetaceae bacterium]|nr:zf-HC2 domain-containing protein [Planctomycetaceae bacterium]
MNCRRAQSDIALWAGNDLDETDLHCLQRHLEACPECREYNEQMHALMRLVEECPLRDEADAASKSVVEESLWPSLSTRLATVPTPRNDRFNGWVPAVAVAAVCLAMVLIASPPRVSSPQESSHASVVSEVQETNLSDATSTQRVQEPLRILPVQEALGPPPNLADIERERRLEAQEEMDALLGNRREFRPMSPEEAQLRMRKLHELHLMMMRQHGFRSSP